jgi:hypothetical protein
MRAFRIELRGHSYHGLWRPDGPDGLEVRSDYGTAWVELGGRNPSDVAREILASMIPLSAEGLRLGKQG